jgi:hypothetical protein
MKAAWKKISQGLVLGTALTVVGSASAMSAGDGSVGALLGWTMPKDTASTINGRFGFGVDGEYAVIDDLAVGAYFQYSTNTKTKTAIKYKNAYMPFGLTVNYHLPMVEGLYFGANVGMVRSTAKVGTLASASASDISFGAQVGYDYMLADEFSVGAMYQYIWINSDPESGYLNNFFASAKYHF